MFRHSRKKRLLERNVDTVEINRKADYQFRLSFYALPPLEEITVEEFETWAIDRLKVLAEIEACQLRNRTPAEIEKHMKPLIDECLPLSITGSAAQLEEERRKDHYSHFILRLAFCRSPELRDRLTRLESQLFRLRYNSDSQTGRQTFVESLDFAWEPVGETEMAELEPLLRWVPGQKEYLKVDFEQVPDLVGNRMVALKNGKAYIPSSLQITLIMSEFQSRLKRDLETTARAIPRLDEDDRLVPILNHLAIGMPTPGSLLPHEGSDSSIRFDQVDGLAKAGHFPLCMRNMHMRSTADAHAKYDVRQQYGAFLKGIGLTVDESIKFWQNTVFKRQSEDEFRKKYQYNIRHMYGLEGSRINFQPLDCVQIARSHGGGVHGCPYREFSPSNLTAALGQMGISDKQELAKIAKYAEEKMYHVACTTVYELTHPNDRTEYKDGIVHPNIYFARSWNSAKENAASAAETGTAAHGASS